MKRILQIFLPIVFLSIAGGMVYYFVSTKSGPSKRKFQTPTPSVVTRDLEKRDFDIVLKSQGSVRARTRSNLVAEVRGRVMSIADNFQDGAFFEEGDVLLQLDKDDYETELIIAEGSLIQAELALVEEQARYEQASQDWARLNPDEKPNSLVLREPQLREAQANVAGAQARVKTAKRNLERTRIKAPYAGRILTKNVDVGQYIAAGAQIAEIYAVDFAEVRLPLTASQFGFLNLPNVYRGEDPEFDEGPRVVLKSSDGKNEYEWEGKIVRSEGAVDESTRQIFVVAQIDNPYGRTKSGRPPLKVGAFVEAEIEGVTLKDVFVIPRKLLRENTNVLTVDGDNYLNRTKVSLVWQNDEVIVVDGGLKEGDRLCLTYVPFALEGWQVKTTPESVALAGEPKPVEESQKRRPSNSSAGGVVERIQKQLPEGKALPESLVSKLETASKSGDVSSLEPVMNEVKAWALEENIELVLGRPQS